jgi:hypothetical protein
VFRKTFPFDYHDEEGKLLKSTFQLFKRLLKMIQFKDKARKPTFAVAIKSFIIGLGIRKRTRGKSAEKKKRKEIRTRKKR